MLSCMCACVCCPDTVPRLRPWLHHGSRRVHGRRREPPRLECSTRAGQAVQQPRPAGSRQEAAQAGRVERPESPAGACHSSTDSETRCAHSLACLLASISTISTWQPARCTLSPCRQPFIMASGSWFLSPVHTTHPDGIGSWRQGCSNCSNWVLR